VGDGWTLQERKINNQSDWELVSKDAASAKSRTAAQQGGFLPSMGEMSPEDFIKNLSLAIWDAFPSPTKPSLEDLFLGY